MEALRRAADEIRAWDAVVLVGGGASVVPGFPLTPQLTSLVWHAVDADRDVRMALAKEFAPGASSAKTIVGDAPERLLTSFEALAAGEVGRQAFQDGFARLNAERLHRPSPTHAVLVELLHRRIVRTIISLNWDTRLEVAYSARYGAHLPADRGWLYKPHGDASRPDLPWVFPHEPGFVPDTLAEELSELAEERPRVLIIVGYSERDEAIVQRVIHPLERKWRVCRLGPRARGDLAVPLPAEVALPLLKAELAPDPETPGWEYVSFADQRDLGQALLGRRLGPRDASGCPRLPESEAVRKTLATASNALLIGGSGSGKSVTCYQIALDHAREGWEVIRATDLGIDPERLVSVLDSLPCPTVAVVDDAQQLNPTVVHRILERARQGVRVIAASTDPVPSHGLGITIAEERAVGVLAEAFRARYREILPIVRALDDRVGEGYMDEPLERRIQHAESHAKTPWEFVFALTGGWRRARDEVVVLRDRARADLLLVALAARQLATLDAGVSFQWCDGVASVIGRDGRWVERSLNVLLGRRDVLRGHDHLLRCPHSRFAELALRESFKLPKDPEWMALTTLVRLAITRDQPSLRGISRLLFDLRFAQAFPWAAEDVLDDKTLQALLNRCWQVNEGTARGDVAYLLMTLLRWRESEILQTLNDRQELIGRWLTEADADSAYQLGWLLNDTHNQDPAIATTLGCAAVAETLAGRLGEAPLREWPAWSHLMSRLLVAASEDWRARFCGALEAEPLLEAAANVKSVDVPYFNYLAKMVALIDRDLGLEIVRRGSRALSEAISESPIEAFPDVQDIVWFVLGFAPRFLRRRQPDRDQKRVASTIVAGIDLTRIARNVYHAPRRAWRPLAELLFWLHEVRPASAASLVNQIDLEALDERSAGLWGKFPHELRVLLGALAVEPNHEPARSWLLQHANELERLDPMMAIVCPEAALVAVRSSHQLPLNVESGLGWSEAAAAISCLAKVDETETRSIIASNLKGITKGLRLPQPDKCEGLAGFLNVIEEVAPDLLHSAVANIRPDDVESNWIARLRGKVRERRAVARLLEIAMDLSAPIAALAKRLRDRFPSTRGSLLR